MAKTEETLIIEDVLYQNLFGSNPCLAREYGTKEVTVTLLKEKKVKEIYICIEKKPFYKE